MVQLHRLLLAAVLPVIALGASNCTAASAIVRKEYGSLTKHERLRYVRAIKCVLAKPSLLHSTVPAATNRFGDYAAMHINLTASIHFDGIFLSWHRHFVWLFEQELHRCGWPASLGIPYWNWALYPDLEASPMFDGSPTSLGGNGLYDPVPNGTYTALDGTVLPGGTGGGCVATGPFANHTIYFQRLYFDTVLAGLPADWTVPAPHCLSRDLNSWGVRAFNNHSDIEYSLAKLTVGDFSTDMSAYSSGLGLHGGGHYAIGGTAFEFFGSPQDPAFYLHHSMLDKVWDDWQAADPVNRRYVYNGTSTLFNADTTPEVTNSTVLEYGVLGRATAEEVQDPLSGPYYCYMYE